MQPTNTSADQPKTWTLLYFDVAAESAEGVASSLADVLDRPGWYVDYRTEQDTYVIFPGRVFHYRRGDSDARAEAVDFGRQLGIPETQLDWPK